MIKIKAMGGTECLYQWDTNRTIIITPTEGCQVTSVEFFNGTTDKAPSVEIEESEGVLVAKIPNSFLQSSNRIKVFLIFEDENGRKTIASKSLSVVARPQPAGYVAEPDEVRSWHELYEMLAEILENPVDAQAVAAAVEAYMELNPVEVPKKTSDLQNDSDYRTGEQVEQAIVSAIAEQTHWRFEKAAALPEIGEENVIYLIPSEGEAGNEYEEYVFVNGMPELIGSTKIDLSGYLPKADLGAAINDALAQAKESGEFDGKDYVLTDDDKQEIAETVNSEIEKDTVKFTEQALSEEQKTQARCNIDTPSKEETELLKSRMDSFTSLQEGSTTGDAELLDARVDCEGKTHRNVGNHIREISGKIIDACCDKVFVGRENYNLLKPSEITYQHRLQNDSTELIASNVYNAVTGFIPVEYGKYYTMSFAIDGARITSLGTASCISRINTKTTDGTVHFGQRDSLTSSPASHSTYYINDPDIVAIQMQINIQPSNGLDISTAENMRALEVMFIKGDTRDDAYNNALSLEYMDGDAEGDVEVFYVLKEDESKANKTEVEEIQKNVEELKENVSNGTLINSNVRHNDNFIPNDRFIRAIANVRDSENAKEFEISITNNSGSTIKNASIVVGMHNTVGINPANNNLPFQVYDEMFSEPVGFKFFDGDTELPYYIESESDCNYIVDKNVRTDQKTIAVFSDGKIAVYNGTVSRMQISSDDGLTWTNICNEITSRPYRVLLPDSQNNLFVASNDGRKLYKYTSTDSYMVGTEVIDMAAIQENIGTDVEILIGSILAEDIDGNLYLGTYQSDWCCVIMKSTDHGNTWNVVFNTTECQHVHNIYVNTKATPNEIFIGLDNNSGSVQTHVSTDAGVTWTKIDVPYRNGDYAFRYAGENFYIGCGERNILGGAALYKTSDYNDPDAYYTLFDNCQGIRDVINVVENSDDVLIAGGCVDDAVRTQQLFLSENRGETWKTVLMDPHYANEQPAGKGLRTFSRKGTQILSETNTGHCMRFVYGNGARTTLAVVRVGDISTNGKTITLKTGYVANIEQVEEVLTSYEQIDGKVADIHICDGCVIDKVSNKRVLTNKTELCNSNIRIGQTSEIKNLENHAYKLNGSVNLGKLSRLNFTKGFTVSLLFKKEDGKNYLEDDKYHVIFQSGDTKLILWYRSLILMSGDTNIFARKLYLEDAYLNSPWDAYLRVTAYFTDDDLPLAGIYTNNTNNYNNIACTEYPIMENLSSNDFIIGNALGSDYAGIPNIARIEIYNRVLTHGEVMSLTNGCNLVTNGSRFN